MEQLAQVILKTIRLFVGALLIASVFLICANAAGRYVFFSPIIWAEEVLGYVLVWTVYLGAVLVTWDGGHLRMDLMSRTLSGPARLVTNGFSVLVFIATGGIIVYQSFDAIAQFTHHSQVAELSEREARGTAAQRFVAGYGRALYEAAAAYLEDNRYLVESEALLAQVDGDRADTGD